MNLLLIVSALALIVHLNYERFFKKLTFKNVPLSIRSDQDSLNMGVIPDRLAWTIPIDYELSEDTSMSSRIETIFIDGVKTPLWALIITLVDKGMKSETTVLYDLDGELYEY